MNVLTLVLLAVVQPSAPDVEELTRLEAMWNEAHEKGDAEALDRLWADDFVATVPGMPSFSKAESLGVWRSGRMRFDRYESSELDFHVHRDTAVVIGRVQRARSFDGRSVEEDWRFTKVYLRTPEGWRVLAFHASPSPP